MAVTMSVNNLCCGYGDQLIIENLSMTITSGEVLCLLGPNGVGKTTLFKSMLGFLPIASGEILINREDIRNWKRNKLAKYVGYVPQAHMASFPFTVLDVVVLGRIAHLGMVSSPSKTDMAIAEDNLLRLGIGHLRERAYTEISGGERQLVMIARALTQESQILVLDEPTASLDFGNQTNVLAQTVRLANEGFAVVMTTHSPDHAFLCSSKVVLLLQDSKFIVGTAAEVLTEANLREAYGVDVQVLSGPDKYGNEARSCVPVLAGNCRGTRQAVSARGAPHGVRREELATAEHRAN
jgi:iron complex transport system ATP-binding protein